MKAAIKNHFEENGIMRGAIKKRASDFVPEVLQLSGRFGIPSNASSPSLRRSHTHPTQSTSALSRDGDSQSAGYLDGVV